MRPFNAVSFLVRSHISAHATARGVKFGWRAAYSTAIFDGFENAELCACDICGQEVQWQRPAPI